MGPRGWAMAQRRGPKQGYIYNNMLFSSSSGAKVEDFHWHEFIDQGAYGEVYRVTDKQSGRVFAIKKIDKFKVKMRGMVTQICNEIRIMYEIKHKNIVRIFDHFESQNHLCLVMEYAKASLYKLLAEQKTLPEQLVVSVMRDIVSAVEYLHRKKPPIIHRDIKPSNVLIDERDSAKLADFGWSNHAEVLRVTYCGTEPYLAPEMILKKGHDEKLDYWCLGVLAYELLSGVLPFTSGLDARTVQKEQMRARLHQNILSLNYAFPGFFSEAARSFVSGLLQIDPNKRLNIAQMKEHEFLSAVRTIPKALQELPPPKEDTQVALKALSEKLNAAEKLTNNCKERILFFEEEIRRVNAESADTSRELQNLRELNARLQAENRVLLEKAQRLEEAEKRLAELTKASREQEAELDRLRVATETQEEQAALLGRENTLIKECWQKMEDQYLKTCEELEELKLRQSEERAGHSGPRRPPNSPYPNQQLLPDLLAELKKLSRQVALTREADLGLEKELKYMQLAREITQLKELEFEHQRDFERLIEEHETRMSDLVNMHNLEIQKLLYTMRELEDAKDYADMMVDLLLLKMAAPGTPS